MSPGILAANAQDQRRKTALATPDSPFDVRPLDLDVRRAYGNQVTVKE